MQKHPYDKQDETNLIISAIKRIANKIHRTPTQKDYKLLRSEDELSLDQVYYRFGKWSNAIVAAGLKPNDFQNPPRQEPFDSKDLIDDFIRVANIENKIPSQHFFRVNSKYSWTPYKTKWGSWKNAIDYILCNHYSRLNFEVPRETHVISEKKRKKLTIDCPLIYEPTNEYETIVLFTSFSKQLGYKILKVQSDFPDAILIKDGAEILVEFEFLSSNYLQHCHPLDFKGICICWRKDCELGNIKIISLEDLVRSLN
jgi:hypothetical protein